MMPSFFPMVVFKFSLIALLFALILASGCLTAIDDFDSSRDKRCFLEPDPGPCEAAIPRFYLGESGDCEQFLWGGCDGVAPFESLEECRQACGITVTVGNSWDMDGIVLMQHEVTGEFGCFGCSEPSEEPALCIDPIIEMKLVQETPERHCSSDFQVVELNAR
jgi:hypothetical protein